MLWMWNWMVFFSSWFFMPSDVVLCYNLILRKLLSQGSQGTGWACCFCNFCLRVLRVIVHNHHYSACLALELLLLLPFVQMVFTSTDIGGVHILYTPVDINIWGETKGALECLGFFGSMCTRTKECAVWGCLL